MAIQSPEPLTTDREQRQRGRTYLWAGIGLVLVSFALVVVQYSVLKRLVVPWYLPVLSTLGALLLVLSIAQRRSITRIVTLVLILALAGFEWYFLAWLSRLPAYQGPAQAGQEMPAFHTMLANGATFTDNDLRQGMPTVLTFFRGRW
jgi:FtsH-binding integral membrane protein